MQQIKTNQPDSLIRKFFIELYSKFTQFQTIHGRKYCSKKQSMWDLSKKSSVRLELRDNLLSNKFWSELRRVCFCNFLRQVRFWSTKRRQVCAHMGYVHSKQKYRHLTNQKRLEKKKQRSQNILKSHTQQQILNQRKHS